MKMRHFPASIMIAFSLIILSLLFCVKQLPITPDNEFSGSISGFVQSRYPGGPLQGVLVSTDSSQNFPTNKDGRFKITGVKAGTYELHFIIADYEDTSGITVKVATGQDISLSDTIRLSYSYYILKGRIVHNSLPIPYAGVAVGNTSINVLSTDGNFKLDKVPKSLPIELICAKSQIGFATKKVTEPQVVANAVTELQDIELNQAGSTVSGIVYDTANNPIPNIVVKAIGGGLTDTTGADGSYHLENVPSNTSSSIRIYVTEQDNLTSAVGGFNINNQVKLDGVDIWVRPQADLAPGKGIYLTMKDILVIDTASSAHLVVYPTTDDTTVIKSFRWTLNGKITDTIITNVASLDLPVDSLKHIALPGSNGMTIHVTVLAVNLNGSESKQQSFDVTIISASHSLSAKGSSDSESVRKGTVPIGIDIMEWDFGDNTSEWTCIEG